ncbi:MAG: bifunctional diaminohydroxyphosphoribosylaminopyrimidine deaminase/5-amino-6-(5-phosphoribosylamino)uracil reductase RibD [Rhodospirillaceae bacterium]
MMNVPAAAIPRAVAYAATDDRRFMETAMALARRKLGTVWPNPSVGCVLVKDGVVVGRGSTASGGRPHAETEALARAGAAAGGATAYVSLEPCNHHGKTPPCTEALIAAGIARCVVACEDSDPRVSGSGVARLRAAGISVECGLLAAEAMELNRGFFLRVAHNRPLVTLKLATSLDGRVATHGGHSRWITGGPARAAGHGLRASHDAIMVGIRTALADNPELTCRLPGLESHSPVRVIADSRLQLPLTSRLARSARAVPVWLCCRPDAGDARAKAFADCGVDVLRVPADAAGMTEVGAMLHALADRGITRIMVEGGGQLAGSLLRAGLVDRLEWFRAPRLIGGDGIAAVAAFGVDTLDFTANFTCTGVRRAGDDLWESFVRAER